MILITGRAEIIQLCKMLLSLQVQTEAFKVKEEIADEQSEVELESIDILQLF